MAMLECECGLKIPTPSCGRNVVCSCSRSYRCMIDIPQLASLVISNGGTVHGLEAKVHELEARLKRLEPVPR